MLLKPYQDHYVQKLINTTLQLAVEDGSKSIVFKAPTGSGKTVMMQEYLKRLAETPKNRPFAVVWISVNDLSRQSKKSFERNLASSALRFSELTDIADQELKENEILFINWESIKSVDKATGAWKVLAMKENERNANLPTYLANTHEMGRDIILVVDESHRSLDTPKAQELIQTYIKPKLQIEVSATPDSADYDAKIEVKVQEVIDAGMIKREVLINPWLQVTEDTPETDVFIISEALKKAQELREWYEAVGSAVRPLVLIQLPSQTQATTDLDVTKMERTKRILEERFGISVANKKLAIWLSGTKENLDDIESYDSPVEVLIFKQAIATGWDCPRAQILVMFREIRSVTFEIQTVGRILRMPEQKHYGNALLDTAYVYTDLERAHIGIHEMAKNVIKGLYAKRKEIYTSLALPSQFLRRVDYNDIGYSFYHLLPETFLSYIGSTKETPLEENLAKLRALGVETERVDLRNAIMTDGKILVDIDAHTNEKIYSHTSIETKTQEELVKMAFDAFCREQVRPQFGNIERSYKSILETLYLMLDDYVFGRHIKTRYYFQCLILSNKAFFIDVLTLAKDTYLPKRRSEVEAKRKDQIIPRRWEVPLETAFSDGSILLPATRSIIAPFYTPPLSQGEKLFIEEYLEKHSDIVWWYRNGVSSDAFFSLVYKDAHSETQNFFPDFIVLHQDGTIGVFDPKNGVFLEQDRPKHAAFEWLQNECKNLWKSVRCGFIQCVGEQNPVFYRSVNADYSTDGSMGGWERM